MNGKAWTEAEIAVLHELYPHVATKEIAKQLGRYMGTVYQKALKLGLKKTVAYLASPDACRLRRGNEAAAAFRFKPGQDAWNKGMKLPGWTRGRMAETQFKPGVRQGVAARLWCPIGTIKADADGFLRIKIRDATKGEYTGFGNVRVWPQLHRYNWEQVNGPVPAGHAIVFRDGKRDNCDIANLECISRGDLMRRNTIHQLPEELKSVIRLQGVLKRKIRSIHEEHAGRPAEPSI